MAILSRVNRIGDVLPTVAMETIGAVRLLATDVVYISSRYSERDIHSCHVLINVISLHYRRSTIHIPDNVSKPSDIVEIFHVKWKKFYVNQINFNSYITTLATRPGSPIGKVISWWKCNPERRGNGSSKTPPRPPRPPRRRTMPRPRSPLPTPLD
jgi:hypothetical protein